MTCTAALANETVWFDKYKCDDAEQQYYERSHKLQWIKSSSEVMPKTPKTEEKLQAKVEPVVAKPTQGQAVAAHQMPVGLPVGVQPVSIVASQTAPIVPASPVLVPAPIVAPQPITTRPSVEGSKIEEKDTSEKEVEVKKSKKSKKNKNKKNQQSAEMKGAAVPPPQQQPAEAKKASTPVDGKEPQRKADSKKEPQQQKAEVKKEPPPQPQKVENKKEQQQQQKPEAKKEQAPTHEGKKGKTKDKETKKDGAVLAGGDAADILARLSKLEVENKQLSKVKDDVKNLTSLLSKLTLRLETLEKSQKGSGEPTLAAPAARPKASLQQKPQLKEEDDDVNLFGSDDEDDAERERLKAERLKMYEDKKAKKPTLIAKSNIILDVKPWDDETDMKAMEAKVREVACDGLLWGASKLVPLAYGIYKLQISCVIEDEKVSVDWLQETIEANEDMVQSVDIAAFNKV